MAFGISGLVLGLISFFFWNPFGLISVAGMVLSILDITKKVTAFRWRELLLTVLPFSL